MPDFGLGCRGFQRSISTTCNAKNICAVHQKFETTNPSFLLSCRIPWISFRNGIHVGLYRVRPALGRPLRAAVPTQILQLLPQLVAGSLRGQVPRQRESRPVPNLLVPVATANKWLGRTQAKLLRHNAAGAVQEHQYDRGRVTEELTGPCVCFRQEHFWNLQRPTGQFQSGICEFSFVSERIPAEL